jgi:hypothetical protein
MTNDQIFELIIKKRIYSKLGIIHILKKHLNSAKSMK